MYYPQRTENNKAFRKLLEKVQMEANVVCDQEESKWNGDFYYLYSVNNQEFHRDYIIYKCSNGSLHQM